MSDGNIQYEGVSEFFFVKNGHFLWKQSSGQTLLVPDRDVKRTAKIEFGCHAAEAQDAFVHQIQIAKALDYAGPMPGYREGPHQENGQLFYCMAAPKMLSPISPQGGAFGEGWPIIREIMRRLFCTDSTEDQFWTVLAHLKLAHQELRRLLESDENDVERSVRPGQALALVGPRDCGQSFFVEQVIAPVLGGRKVDAFKAFTAEADGFNGELLNGEVWFIDDQESSTDIRTRRKFAAQIKSKLFGASMAFHVKYQTPITLKPFGRLFICCNDTPENLSVLPPITEDIADKIHLVRCNKAQMPMPTQTEEERKALRDTVRSELPHFIGDLLKMSIPAAITHHRTGVHTFQNPWVLDQLKRQAPETQLAELILSAFDADTLHGDVWEGSSRELKDRLTSDTARFSRDARALLSWQNAAGTYLARLAGDQQERTGLHVSELGQRSGIMRFRIEKKE